MPSRRWPADRNLAFSLRPATADDRQGVDALLAVSYPLLMAEAYGPLLVELLPFIAKANPALLTSGRYFLVEGGNGAVVAAGGWSPERPGTGDLEAGLGHIRHFVTHPDYAGRGLGAFLFDVCRAMAEQQEVRRFDCYASLNAVGFYGRIGFTALRPMDVPITPQLAMPACLMRFGT
ncbi:MAG: GNAT family N-acetyltransferase [Rhodospirillales bacterium]